MTDLEERVAAIEARQRAYTQHDPGCPAMGEQAAKAAERPHFEDRPCDCWLSVEGPQDAGS